MPQPILLVCPSCAAINRVDPARAADAACGKCQGKVFAPAPVELSQAAFDRHVGRTSLPVLVDFYSPECGPCRMMAPQFSQAAATLHPRVRLYKVNTAVEQGLAARFNIMSVPTLALFRDGREVARQPGALSAQDIVRWVDGQILLSAHADRQG